jgi:hypothetical protein
MDPAARVDLIDQCSHKLSDLDPLSISNDDAKIEGRGVLVEGQLRINEDSMSVEIMGITSLAGDRNESTGWEVQSPSVQKLALLPRNSHDSSVIIEKQLLKNARHLARHLAHSIESKRKEILYITSGSGGSGSGELR